MYYASELKMDIETTVPPPLLRAVSFLPVHVQRAAGAGDAVFDGRLRPRRRRGTALNAAATTGAAGMISQLFQNPATYFLLAVNTGAAYGEAMDTGATVDEATLYAGDERPAEHGPDLLGGVENPGRHTGVLVDVVVADGRGRLGERGTGTGSRFWIT